MTAAAATAHYADTVRSFRAQPVKAGWVEALRQKALDRFDSLGFPDRHWESWRYLTLTKLLETSFQRPSGSSTSIKSGDACFAGASCRMVFVNGLYCEPLSSRAQSPLDFSELGSALSSHPELQSRLGLNLETEENPFVLINTFAFESGALIRIPKGFKASEPLHLFFMTEPQGGATASVPRILMIAEAGSEASVVCHFEGSGSAGEAFENAAAEIHLEKDARVHWLNIQKKREESGTLFFHSRVYLKEEASFDVVTFNRGREVTRNEIRVELEGPRASCRLNGLSVLSGLSRVYHEVTANHKAEAAVSRQFYKNLLDGSSVAEFNSLAYVFPGAQKSDSNQLNKNLLLSDDARVYSRPKLKIYADDVQASHGSANGQSDTQELFYLRSRGLDRKTARFVLAFGFAEEILQQIQLPEIREALEEEVRQAVESMIRE